MATATPMIVAGTGRPEVQLLVRPIVTPVVDAVVEGELVTASEEAEWLAAVASAAANATRVFEELGWRLGDIDLLGD